MSAALPEGFRVRLVDDVIMMRGGTVLVGGSPFTSLRIKDPDRKLHEQLHLTVTDRASARIADRLLATNLALPDFSTTPSPPREELTVVVPVRDRPEQLDRCLTSLAGLACVVVDDGSLDAASIAGVASRHAATLITLERNVGPAAARNCGLARVQTRFVAFVDSDVEVRSLELRSLLRHFSDPAVVLVGPRVVGRSQGRRARWFERYEGRDSSLTLGTRSGCVRPGAAVAWLPSACLVGRTASLGSGFDPGMRVAEDVDLVWRLTDAGRRVRYDADVEARHDTRATIRGWLGRKAFYGSGSALLAHRHPAHVAPAVLSPTYALAGAAVLSRRPVALPLAAVALLRGWRAVTAALPSDSTASQTAARVAARGLGWAIRQESALILRHWWPATVLAAVLSHRARRMILTALLVDVVVVWRETDSLPLSDLPSHLLARRLDDLAYGAGLWCGVVRAWDASALTPRWVRSGATAKHTRHQSKSRDVTGTDPDVH